VSFVELGLAKDRAPRPIARARGRRERGIVRADWLAIALAVPVIALVVVLNGAGMVAQNDGDGDPELPTRGRPSPRPAATGGKGLYDAAVDRAVRRGLSFLAREQNDDGSWTDRVGRKVYNRYEGRIAKHVGVTALAGIAFLSSGAIPGEGPGKYSDRQGRAIHGYEIVEKALEFIVERTAATGYISENGSRMYSHAFATLFLAEAYGMGYDRGGRIESALRRAIRMIETCQNADGGWRYRPGVPDADMSVTVCQVVALRAARNAGVGVDKAVIDAAVRYVRRSFLPGIGAFTYQLGDELRGGGSRYTFALTAAGLTTLYGAGEYQATEILQAALRFLWVNRPHISEAREHFDYYYGQYYAIQAMFQRGGEDWRRWYEEYVKPDLSRLQESDGSWTDLVGARYATAMATIILQFPNQYLPITEN
jgi:hypothetical protein